jgi:lysophospholipase L1-like esterase
MGLRGILRNNSGGVVASDENTRIGVQGNSHVTVGDSITEGFVDLFYADNQSSDGRIIGKQGYQARLNDLLTTSTSTSIVFNEGVSGDKTSDTLTRIDSILERHPDSNRVLMMLGTNDLGSTFLTQSAYQANMQSLVDTITGQGKSLWVALLPPVLPYAENTILNGDVKGYNAAITNLTNIQTGPDFYSFFYDDNNTPDIGDDNERISLFADTVHPNALGIRIMGDLWANVLKGTTTTPFFLDRLCNRLISPDCSAVSPTNHKQNLLDADDAYYIDEAYTLSSIPAGLADGIWVVPSNAESTNTSADYIEFTVDRPVRVFVAYDSGASSLPNWLDPSSSDFEDSFLEISTTDPLSPALHVYSQAFSAGTVTLGGNMATGATGVDSNYLVIVVEQ